MSTAATQVSTHELVWLWKTAQAMAASGKLEGAFTAEEAYARILAGRDLGLTPSDSMVHMNYLNGRFEPGAEIQGALLKAYVGADGERFDYRAVRGDTECLVIISRRETGGPWEEIGDVTFTMDDARRAGLHDSSDFWRKWPRRMLFWRALCEAIEAYAPQVLHPVYAPVSAHLAASAVDLEDVLAELPKPAGNPAERARDGEDAHGPTAGHWLQIFSQIVRRHEKRGTTGRIVEVLDAVGAPEGDTLLNRFAQLPDGNAAHEVIYRLDRNRTRRENADDSKDTRSA